MSANSGFAFIVCSGEPTKSRPSSFVRQHVMNTYLEKNGKAKSQRPKPRKMSQNKKGSLVFYEPETRSFHRSGSSSIDLDESDTQGESSLATQVWTPSPRLNIGSSFDPFNSLPVPAERSKSLAPWYFSVNIAHLCAYESFPRVSANASRLREILRRLRWDTAMKSEGIFDTLLCVCADKRRLLEGGNAPARYLAQKGLALQSLQRMLTGIGMSSDL